MKKVTDLGYWMDGYLKSNCDSIIYNLEQDWDFIFIITGDGMTRVGKSVLAQQIGYYIAYNLKTPFDINNIIFSGAELIKKGTTFPPKSVFVYDEARADLDNKKQMHTYTKNLLDYFAECGMYNHFIILVLPEFFELPKTIALNRAEALINVKRETEVVKTKDGAVINFKRGKFDFYNKVGKRKLYFEGKKNFNFYNPRHRVFYGEFRDFSTINKEAYTKRKIEFLRRDRDDQAKRLSPMNDRRLRQRNIAFKIIIDELGWTQTKLAKVLKDFKAPIDQTDISKNISNLKLGL